VREVQTRIRELEEAPAQLADARQESGRLGQQLQDARLAVDTTRWHFETVQKRLEEETLRLTRELRDAQREADRAQERFAATDAHVTVLERRIAGYESKTFAGIAKRALQVALDTFQLLTPGPLRAAFRKYYLNWFYFRIYPERRADAPPAQSRDS
jgi:chromosome segregation ATPase